MSAVYDLQWMRWSSPKLASKDLSTRPSTDGQLHTDAAAIGLEAFRLAFHLECLSKVCLKSSQSVSYREFDWSAS